MFKPDIKQGVVHVNHAWIESKSGNIVLIQMDLREKYAVVTAVSDQYVMMTARKDEDGEPDSFAEHTVINFKDMPNEWTIHNAWVSRYNLNVLLLKKNFEEREEIWTSKEINNAIA